VLPLSKKRKGGGEGGYLLDDTRVTHKGDVKLGLQLLSQPQQHRKVALGEVQVFLDPRAHFFSDFFW
jgi:hypothetical protein